MTVPSLFGAVDAVLVAEFDIDKGSALSFQYPVPTGTDVHVLSELMLPDGAHLREEDWTMFLLNQSDAAKEKAAIAERREEFSRRNPATVAVSAIAFHYSLDTNTWSAFGQASSKVLLQLNPTFCLMWDDQLTTHVEFPLDRVEYCRAAPMCAYLFAPRVTWAIRFETEEDEVYWLDYIDRGGGVCNHGRERPQTKPPLHEEGDLNPPRPSTYVLNLVRTKHISNVRRGARVKAMAVASRYQWVHVFKPLLVLALDKFFNDPTIGILEDLYNAINCMDMTRMPRLSLRQRNIFRDSEDNSVLDDKFKDDEAKVGLDPHTRMSIAASAAGADSVPASPVGATGAAKSLGNKDRHFFETTVRYGTIRMPVRIPLVLFPEEIGDFSIAQLLLKFGHASAMMPPSSGSKESGSGDNTALKWRNGVPYSWHPHLDIGPQTHPIIVLLNAILTEKRVLFLGDKRPSGEVADYVLATCALAGGGGLLRGFAERCFPYVSLAGVDGLLAVPGYIAGVTNPVFEEQQSWWDVLCNVGTGKISVSQKLVTSQASADRESSKDKEKEWFRTSGYELDHDFISDAMTAAQTHAGEFHIRQKFLHYVQRFVDVTAAFEQVTYKRSELAVQPTHVDQVDLGHGPFFLHERARTREMQIMRNRISGWRTTRSYQYFTQDFPTFLQRRATRSLDPRHIVNLLRNGSITHGPSVVKLFLSLQDVYGIADENMIEELLSLLPQTQGGLFPIATGLFFGRWEARRATVRLLRRVGWDKVGKKFIAHLNPMIRLAYLRAHREFYGDEPVPGVVVRALQGDKTRGPAGGGPSMHASLKVPTSTTDGESKSAASSTGPSPNSSPAPVRSTLGVAPTTSSSQTSLSAQSQSNTTTPPSTVPVSPLVKRMLLQQQQRQELLKAKLTALGNETPALMFQDTLNPDFGRRDVSPPEDGRTGIEQQQQPQEQQQLHPIVTNGLQQQPIPAASAASHAGKAPVNPPPSGPTPLAPKRFQSMPTSTNSSPYSSPPRQQQPPETAAVGAAKTPLLPPLVTSVSAKTSPHRHPAPQLPHASPHQLNPQQQQPSQPSPASPYYPPKSPYSSPGTPAACIPHHDQSSAASSFSITEHTVRIGNITPTSARLSAAPTISASFVVPPPINTTTTTTLRILSGYNDNSIGNSLETLGSLPDEQRSDDDGHGQRASYIEDDPDDSYGNFMQFYGQDEDSPSP